MRLMSSKNNEVLTAKLSLLENQRPIPLKEGHLYYFKLTLWPIDHAKLATPQNDSIWKQWDHTKIQNSLYIFDSKDLGASPFNPYVHEVLLKGIFLRKISPYTIEILSFENKKISLSFEMPKFSNDKIKMTKDFFYYPSIENTDFFNFSSKMINYNLMGKSVLMIILLTLFFIFFYKGRSKRRWKKYLFVHHSREDWEDIYEKRFQWLPYIKKAKAQCHNFLEYLKIIQYKKEWSEYDKQTLNEYFNEFIKYN